MKKVLILTCSTGQGHNSCAAAIEEYFKTRGVECDITDSMTFFSEGTAKFISWGHSFIYRHLPWLFKWGYSFTKRHKALLGENSPLCALLQRCSERLRDYIERGDFDTVICTHLFPAIAITGIQRNSPVDVLAAFVFTDYTAYPGTEALAMDRYFVPDEDNRKECLQLGLPEEKVTVTGIPVRQKFFAPIDKARAKQALRLDAGKAHLLVMCGSMGCGPIKQLLKEIALALHGEANVTVICGTNNRLFNQLRKKYEATPGVRVIGYTRFVSLYMDSADLFLTKPGGISVTEASAKALPMAFINAVAGCEQYNMDFFIRHGFAFTNTYVKELAESCVTALRGETQLLEMSRDLQRHEWPNGAKQVFMELESSNENMENGRLYKAERKDTEHP